MNYCFGRVNQVILMKILIIGSDSYIARSFIDQYSSSYDIRMASRVSTLQKKETVYEDLFKISPGLFHNVDVVMNFIAIVHQSKESNYHVYDRINNHLAIDIALKAKQANVKHFIQMSSIAVYGNQSHICEESKPMPITYYAKTKLCADNELIKMRDGDFEVSLLRPPMVYGKGAPGNMSRIILLCQKRIPLPMKGIENRRDFIYIGNLVQYLDYTILKKISGVILVSDRSPISTSELIRKVYKVAGLSPRLFVLPLLFHRIIRLARPGLYNKLFGSCTVDVNLPEAACKNNSFIEDGIKEML